MPDMKIHMGRAAVGGEGGGRWDIPLRAVENGDGTYSLSVTSEGGSTSAGEANIAALLVDIKAELIALNASISAGISVSIG